MKKKLISIKSMDYYLQINDLIIIGIGFTFIVIMALYLHYTFLDREDSPVSKEELGYVMFNTILSVLISGGIVYTITIMRVLEKYPPVDGVDMGEPPF